MLAFMHKTLCGHLAPSCDTSETSVRKLGIGELIEVDIKTRNTRSVKWHKRYWVLCSMIFANCEYVTIHGERIKLTSKDHVHLILKALAGLYDGMITLEDGTKVMLIKSIAFDSMTADEWALAWNQIINVVHMEILPSVPIPQLEEEIARLAS